MMSGILQVLVTALLAILISVGEISSRFRDEPVKVLRSGPSVIYMSLNVALSLAVLLLASAFGWSFGLSAANSPEALQVTRVLVAGLGAALVLRSSLMTVRLGDKDVGVGPSAVLTALLGMLESRIDRKRAGQRLKLDLWHDLSFSDDYGALVELVSYSLQRPDLADAAALGTLVADLKQRSESCPMPSVWTGLVSPC